MVNEDDLDIKTLEPWEGIVWRTDGRGALRVRVGPGLRSETIRELVERVARVAASRWSTAQVGLVEYYEVVVRMRAGWFGPVIIRATRPAAKVVTCRYSSHAVPVVSPRYEQELEECARMRREG